MATLRAQCLLFDPNPNACTVEWQQSNARAQDQYGEPVWHLPAACVFVSLFCCQSIARRVSRVDSPAVPSFGDQILGLVSRPRLKKKDWPSAVWLKLKISAPFFFLPTRHNFAQLQDSDTHTLNTLNAIRLLQAITLSSQLHNQIGSKFLPTVLQSQVIYQYTYTHSSKGIYPPTQLSTKTFYLTSPS